MGVHYIILLTFYVFENVHNNKFGVLSVLGANESNRTLSPPGL